MKLLSITRPPSGPRVYLFGRVRVHHGMSGLIAAIVGAASRNTLVCAGGLAFCFHDLRDFPWCADR